MRRDVILEPGETLLTRDDARALCVCPRCDGPLVERGAALWCDRCHVKTVTCCEGAPQ